MEAIWLRYDITHGRRHRVPMTC